jgi:predicted dehydrogenase
MATTLEDAHAMVEKASATGKRLMVHMNMRFRESNLALGRLSRRGDLGQVYYGRASMLRRRAVPVLHFPPTGSMGRGPWFLDAGKAGGGALMDIGVHTYDLMWWLMGCPKPVAVTASTYRRLYGGEAAEKGVKFDVDELASAYVRFEGGATAFVDVSWAAHQAAEWNVRVFGEKAGLMVSPPTVFRDLGDRLELAAVEVPEMLRLSPQQDFVEAIRDPERPLISTGDQGLEVVKVLDAIRRSAQARHEVAIAG